jgi:hypothetical protein
MRELAKDRSVAMVVAVIKTGGMNSIYEQTSFQKIKKQNPSQSHLPAKSKTQANLIYLLSINVSLKLRRLFY